MLLILAGVTIATLTGDNGILTRASDAKIETALGAVKEAVQLEQVEKSIDGEEINPETLLANGKVLRTVQQGEDGNYYMYYALKEDSYEGMQGLGKGNVASLRDVFLIDDDLHVKYISSNGKEYGDNIEEKILEDETEIRFSSKAFSEYISKISGVTEEEMKFKWMKEQKALEINGASITTLEDLIFFPNLINLTLNGVNLENVKGIENCKKLNVLNLYTTNIKDFSSLANLEQITTILINYGTNNINNLISNIKDFYNIKQLTIYKANGEYDSQIFKNLPISLTNLQIVGANNKIDNISGIKRMINLKYLNLNNNEIENIEEIKYLINLEELYLNNNEIIDITPLCNNILLKRLDLKGNIKIDGNRENYVGNKLTALNKISEILDKGGTINIDIDKLALFTNYQSLDLSGQNLTTLELLEGMTELTSLNLTSNNLTLEDLKSQEILKNMINLKSLNLSGNQITNISVVENLTNLELLDLTNNKISNVSPINNLTNLKQLYITGEENNINLVEIEDIISNLTGLRISTKTLETITNCNVNKITKLNIAYSGINSLPDLSKFNKLIQLNLSNNTNIENVKEISKITSLQTLDLSNCSIHGKMIDFSKLINLTNLNLGNNTLWSEDLENLKSLKNNTNLTINLNNNSIIDASALLELNPNTKIYLSGNVNLSQDSKDKLKSRFGSSVTF